MKNEEKSKLSLWFIIMIVIIYVVINGCTKKEQIERPEAIRVEILAFLPDFAEADTVNIQIDYQLNEKSYSEKVEFIILPGQSNVRFYQKHFLLFESDNLNIKTESSDIDFCYCLLGLTTNLNHYKRFNLDENQNISLTRFNNWHGFKTIDLK